MATDLSKPINLRRGGEEKLTKITSQLRPGQGWQKNVGGMTPGKNHRMIGRAASSLALLQQVGADAFGPGANRLPIPVVAFRPDAKEDTQAKLKPITG